MREIVLEHLEKYPDVNSLTLAKIICVKHPDLVVEKVRSSIRYYRGNKGSRNRNDMKIRQFMRANDGNYNIKAVNISTQDFIFPHKKPLIVSDIHLPYHDINAIEIALEKAYKDNVDSIYLNGDILDFYQVSRFTKEGGAMSIKEERDMFFEFIGWINENFDVPIYFKAGNHEERLAKYINEKAPDLAQLPELSLSGFLKLDELDIQFVDGRQKAMMGKLIVVHGHEFGESIFSPVNPARGLFLRAKSTTLAGHNHQTSEHHENNLKNDSMACFSTGCLCQLTPNYRPFAYTKWNHGFAIVEIDEDESFEVSNYRIIDGKVR
jgi:predicted phosphodiesterase